MKFCKITSTHNQGEINDIIISMSTTETDYIIKIYGQIPMVEYTDENPAVIGWFYNSTDNTFSEQYPEIVTD